MAPRFGAMPTITEAAVSEANIGLALGNQCVSVSHKTRVTNSTLLALNRAGVTYVSTRSIGYNHIDVAYAESVGILVENVAYSPDSVADYTLMLMAVRNAKSTVRRTDLHDYRLHDVRGRELRDLTIGVVGTGRIGTAVVDRLRGFGCRVLAHDSRPGAAGRNILRRPQEQAHREQTAAAAAGAAECAHQSAHRLLHGPRPERHGRELHHQLPEIRKQESAWLG
jgi:D-specific alpha-keto acid dehydrogenase